MTSASIESRQNALRQEVLQISNKSIKLFKGAIPETLYHYTDATGFKGIIESHSIWLTNALYLNDSSEYYYGRSLARDALYKHIRSGISTVLFDAYSIAIDSLNYPGHLSVPYIFCMCKKGDLLTQWRGYSGGKVGFSIGVKAKKLTTMFDGPLILRSVIYDVDDQIEIMESLVSEIVAYLEQQNLNGVSSSEIANYIESAVSSVTQLFKDPAFESENEWRLILLPSLAKGLPIRFRESKLGLTPYAVSVANKTILPLSSVHIGPTDNASLAKSAVNQFIAGAGYKDVEVYSSSIPLRGL